MWDFIQYLFWGQWLLLKALFQDEAHFLFAEKKLIESLHTQFLITQYSDHLHSDTKIILANHRGFSDFFIDRFLVGDCAHLSRWAVAFAIPLVGLYGLLKKRVLFFLRGKTSRRSLTSIMLRHFAQHPSRKLIAYPEGTRYRGLDPIPLRYGILKICFEEKFECQIMITWGKDCVMDERNYSIQRNSLCLVTYSEMIHPQNFNNFQEFYEEITRKWNKLWHQSLRDFHEIKQ